MLIKVLKIGIAHLQCMNHYFANYGYKGTKTVGVTDYTNQTPLIISDGKISKFNTLNKQDNVYKVCIKLELHIFNV